MSSHMCVCLCVCTCRWVFISLCVWLCVYTCRWVFICVCGCTYTHARECAHVCMYVWRQSLTLGVFSMLFPFWGRVSYWTWSPADWAASKPQHFPVSDLAAGVAVHRFLPGSWGLHSGTQAWFTHWTVLMPHPQLLVFVCLIQGLFVVLTVRKLDMQTRLASNSQSYTCLCPSGVHYHA